MAQPRIFVVLILFLTERVNTRRLGCFSFFDCSVIKKTLDVSRNGVVAGDGSLIVEAHDGPDNDSIYSALYYNLVDVQGNTVAVLEEDGDYQARHAHTPLGKVVARQLIDSGVPARAAIRHVKSQQLRSRGFGIQSIVDQKHNFGFIASEYVARLHG